MNNKIHSTKIHPYQDIVQFITEGKIINTFIANVGPASLDITLSKQTYFPRGQTIEVLFNEIVACTELHTKLQYSSRSTTARMGLMVHSFKIGPNGNLSALVTNYSSDDYNYDFTIAKDTRIGQLYFYSDIEHNNDNNLDKNITLVEPIVNHKFMLGSSEEIVEIPKTHVAILEDLCNTTNKYILHLNAGFIDPGFKGKICFEILSLHSEIIKHTVQCKLKFIELTEPTLSPYNGSYQNQQDLKSMRPKRLYNRQ